MFKFLHAADIHLDSPLRGLDQDETAPKERIRNATRVALKNLVDFVNIFLSVIWNTQKSQIQLSIHLSQLVSYGTKLI